MESTSEKVEDNYNPSPLNDIKCWVVTEGMAGTENQCLGVAEWLNLSEVTVKRIGLKFPFNYLCPYILKKAPLWAIRNEDWPQTKSGPWPELILAAGRKAAPVALSIPTGLKVFLQNPHVAPDHFDLVAVPEHDKVRGDNVIVTKGSPNRINDNSLKENAIKFAPVLNHLPSKKLAIIIGGNSKTHTMSDNFAKDLFEKLLPYIRSGEWGFMITASRRTPEAIRANLQSLFSTPNCFYWDGTGDNPYQAFLAEADVILVTEDSASMLSDALTAGKPTYRLPLQGQSAKFNRLYKALEDQGGLRIFDGKLEEWTYPPLNDAKMVADEIKKHFAKTDSSL